MTLPRNIDFKQWRTQVLDVLKTNRAQFRQYRFTGVSPEAPGIQSTWHSALHAIIWRWIDPEMAADELRSAITHQGEDGAIPPSFDWSNEIALHSSEPMIPLLATAAVQVYHLTGDYNLIEKLFPRVVAYHEWWEQHLPPENQIAFHALRAAELDAVGHLAYDLGNRGAQQIWEGKAQAVRYNLQPHVRDDSFSALFGKCASGEQMTRIHAHLRQNWSTFPAHDRESDTVSVESNWLIYMGLKRAEYDETAAELAAKTMQLVEQNGFFRAYNPQTGAGISTPSYSAAGLVLDMIARETMGKARGGQCID